MIATQVLASSPADDHTFMITDGSMFSVNPSIYRNLTYDYRGDFVPVSLMTRSALYLGAYPKTGTTTLQEFIAQARAQSGALNS